VRSKEKNFPPRPEKREYSPADHKGGKRNKNNLEGGRTTVFLLFPPWRERECFFPVRFFPGKPLSPLGFERGLLKKKGIGSTNYLPEEISKKKKESKKNLFAILQGQEERKYCYNPQKNRTRKGKGRRENFFLLQRRGG